MKVAIFTDTFLPKVNGVVTATINLSKGLANKGHEVLLVIPKYTRKFKFEHKSIKIIRCQSIPAVFHKEFRATLPFDALAFNRIKKFNPDVIHFQTPWTIGMQSIFISKILKKPLIGTFHTFISDPDYLKNFKLNTKVLEKIAKSYDLIYYNQCDLVTCPSKKTLEILKKNGCTTELKFISNGIDKAIFDNSKSKEVRKEIMKNSKGKLILYLGRIAPEKNMLFFIDCMKEVFVLNPDSKLILVGDGPQLNKVKQRIKKLKLKDNIITLGKIDHKELVSSGLFGACDFFASASKTENQPITVMESLQNGLPCACVDAKGMGDLVNDSNGLLAKPNNRIEFVRNVHKLINDDSLLKKLSKGAKESMTKHELEFIIHEWEKFYEKLIQNSFK